MKISITSIVALLAVEMNNELHGEVVLSAFMTTNFGTVSTPLSSPSLQRDYRSDSVNSKWYGECHRVDHNLNRFRSSTGAMRMVRNHGLEIQTEGASPTCKYSSLLNHRTLLHHTFFVPQPTICRRRCNTRSYCSLHSPV